MCPVCRMLHALLHLVGILFPHINDDARSKSHQNSKDSFVKVEMGEAVGRGSLGRSSTLNQG